MKPVPLSANSLRGVTGSSEATERVAFFGPTPPGEKTTSKVQSDPAATAPPEQPSFWTENPEVLPPRMATRLTCRSVVSWLLIVNLAEEASLTLVLPRSREGGHGDMEVHGGPTEYRHEEAVPE
jgi:hypothetical protein